MARATTAKSIEPLTYQAALVDGALAGLILGALACYHHFYGTVPKAADRLLWFVATTLGGGALAVWLTAIARREYKFATVPSFVVALFFAGFYGFIIFMATALVTYSLYYHHDAQYAQLLYANLYHPDYTAILAGLFGSYLAFDHFFAQSQWLKRKLRPQRLVLILHSLAKAMRVIEEIHRKAWVLISTGALVTVAGFAFWWSLPYVAWSLPLTVARDWWAAQPVDWLQLGAATLIGAIELGAVAVLISTLANGLDALSTIVTLLFGEVRRTLAEEDLVLTRNGSGRPDPLPPRPEGQRPRFSE